MQQQKQMSKNKTQSDMTNSLQMLKLANWTKHVSFYYVKTDKQRQVGWLIG